MKYLNLLRNKLAILTSLLVLMVGFSPSAFAQFDNIITYNIDNILYVLNDNGTATAYSNAGNLPADLVIPAAVTIDGKSYNVVEVAEAAFAGSQIQSLSLGENIEIINKNSFLACTALKVINFNNKLKSIGNDAFGINIGLPESITLPASLQKLEGAAFRGCFMLKYINFDENNPNFCSEGSLVYSKNKETLVAIAPAFSADEFQVPSNVKNIAEYGFCYANIKKPLLPDGLLTIGKNAFSYSNITSITIPSSVNEIGDGFVANANQLKDIQIAEGNKTFEIQGVFFVDKVRNSIITTVAKYEQPSLVVADGITSIGAYAFNRNPNIETITFPASLKTIGEYAFIENTKLKSVQFGKGDMDCIGVQSFRSCKALTEVVWPASVKTIDEFAFNTTGLTKVNLPDGVEMIGTSSFAYCDDLEEFVMPQSVKELGLTVFANDPKLSKCILSDKIERLKFATFLGDTSLLQIKLPVNLKSIEMSALFNSGIESIDIPQSVVNISKSAIYLTNITELVIPDELEVISNFAFGHNYKLKKAKLGKKVKIIDDLGFNACFELEEIELNEGLDSIGQRALGRTSLRKITLPSTLTKLGDQVFLNDSLLTDVYAFMPEPIPMKEDCFCIYNNDTKVYENMCPKLTLHVPMESVEAYKAAPVWKTFGKIVGTAGISDIENDDELIVKDIYDINGCRHDNYVKGLNIIRYTNGKIEKVFRK